MAKLKNPASAGFFFGRFVEALQYRLMSWS
jgi:hypothetical protein